MDMINPDAFRTDEGRPQGGARYPADSLAPPFGKRVVFVLGAGASAPYGFPLGSELLDLMLNPDPDDIELLRTMDVDGSHIKDFVMTFAYPMSSLSISSFN
ncbi:MAG: hypothetical protein IPK67_18645 [Planctomycetes bacterium]|nr:hypothetical protein [Planctomycetota bacterium]